MGGGINVQYRINFQFSFETSNIEQTDCQSIVLALYSQVGPGGFQKHDQFNTGSLVGLAGARVVVSTADFYARVRGSFPGLSSLKETQMFLPHPLVKLNIVGSIRDREIACSASDL